MCTYMRRDVYVHRRIRALRHASVDSSVSVRCQIEAALPVVLVLFLVPYSATL